ncbi:MAG: tetratricopeptide repeat protein [Nevskiaceae bacterium]|nr:MAG: tetratricopeptide repeat protein [Nevskiaceae bacterium]
MNASSPADAARESNQRAMAAMAAGDFSTARETLKQALRTSRDNLSLWLNLAACCRALGELQNALSAVEEALKIQPRLFTALLMKGSLLEQLHMKQQAAKLYGAAMAVAPPDDALDPPTKAALQRARQVHARYLEELTAFINAEIDFEHERGGSAEARRIRSFIELSLRKKKNFRQEPTDFFYPGLPAIQFWERSSFPWLMDFERASMAIGDELSSILRDDFRDFMPYVAYPEGLPLDQWQPLNHSRKWGALHLLKYGERVEENCRRCPATMKALSLLPQPVVPGHSPAAMFSALQPHTRIPPHTGVANTRLVVHLPLVVPEDCGFRVGNETKFWRVGEAWIFDDTIEHEAWNDSDEPRVIFICDIWNPLLNENERALVTSVITAMDRFHGAAPVTSL